jgi:hypothetical protein
MPLDISFKPMRVRIDGHDSEGRLVLVDDQLVAVIVRLDGQSHAPDQRGLWHLEAGFGMYNVPRPMPLFKTLEEAGAWVERALTREAMEFNTFMES